MTTIPIASFPVPELRGCQSVAPRLLGQKALDCSCLLPTWETFTRWTSFGLDTSVVFRLIIIVGKVLTLCQKLAFPYPFVNNNIHEL